MISIRVSKPDILNNSKQSDIAKEDLKDIMAGIEQVKRNQVKDWNEVYDEIKAEFQSIIY